MLDWHDYVSQFPMTPYGGVFLTGVGVCIIGAHSYSVFASRLSGQALPLAFF